MVVLTGRKDAEILIVVVYALLRDHKIERMVVVDIELVVDRIGHRQSQTIRREPLGRSLLLVWDKVRI